MKKFVVLLVLLMAAFTFQGNNETPPVSIAILTNPSPVPASAMHALPTATSVPTPTQQSLPDQAVAMI
jgi:hypothetical protein